MKSGRKRLSILAAAALLALVLALASHPVRTRLDDWLHGGRPPAEIVVSGNIEAHASVLSFKSVQSRVVQLPFDEGRWVEQGTLIAAVDDADYRQQVAIQDAALAVQQRQLAVARQNLAAARKTVVSDEADVVQKRLDLQRSEDLWSRGFVSSAVRDQSSTTLTQVSAVLERDRALLGAAEENVQLARAAVRNAEEALKLARITESYTALRAPFAGVILVRQAELGEVVGPGTPIVTLADLDHVWLRAYINESDLGKVRHDQPVTVTTDTYPGKQYAGRVSLISSTAEFTPKTVETHAQRVTLVYRIRIDISNPSHELVPGMPADARLRVLPPESP